MAFWVVRKGCVPDMLPVEDHYHDEHERHGSPSSKRRGSGCSFEQDNPDHIFAKRARLGHGRHQRVTVLHHDHHDYNADGYAHRDDFIAKTLATKNPPFIVIREHSSSSDLSSSYFENHHHQPPSHSQIQLLNPAIPSPVPMERTASGHSISSSDSPPPPDEPPSLLSDFAAAQLMHRHLSSVNRNARHARILRALVYPKTPSRSRDFTIDDDALESIFSAANDLFFANKLRGRVTWDWSHPEMASAGRYDCAIVGTTCLRKRRGHRSGGYETLIVLSSPILKDTKYNRRLLISTFLHEMIHSFLFVMCGRKAGINGGHTEGFRKIAADIDDWVGRECLRLTDMEADLERFTVDKQCDLDSHSGHRGAIFTELDGHMHHQTQHQYENHHHHHRGGDVYYDEMATSPMYPSVDGHHHHHHHHEDGDGWQWQRQEGSGASSRGSAY